MTELARAIEEADWPRALVLALDAWRESRAPVLADLVDRIAARLPPDLVPRERVQHWWMREARVYDPLRATTLLANAAELALRTGVDNKLVERFHVLATWPDDPRVARVFATWFADANVGWRSSHDDRTIVLYQQLADHLMRLRDIRALAILERALAEPRGLTVTLQERQRALATHVIGALADMALHAPSLANAGEIARWCPSPAPPPMSLDERTLWREAARSEDARLVLADSLLDRGDRRGEIITLASTGETAGQASALLHEHWERWMGDLALVLDRGNCSFVGGLLDVATVGIYSSPEWAYPKVARHRELSTARIIRPGWNASERGYVAFLDALEDLPPRIRLTARMLESFALARAHWPVRHLELVTNAPLPHVLRLAARAMPDVEVIDIPMPSEIDDSLIAAIPTLPSHFPKLTRVSIDASRWIAVALRAALVELEALPFVEIDHGPERT